MMANNKIQEGKEAVFGRKPLGKGAETRGKLETSNKPKDAIAASLTAGMADESNKKKRAYKVLKERDPMGRCSYTLYLTNRNMQAIMQALEDNRPESIELNDKSEKILAGLRSKFVDEVLDKYFGWDDKKES